MCLAIALVAVKIIFFGPMDQKLQVFEVFRRSMGKTGMCWSNEEELTTCGKIWEQRGRKEGVGGFNKGDPRRSGWRPLVAPDRATACRPAAARSATATRPLAAGRRLCRQGVAFKKNKNLELLKKNLKALACSKGLGFFTGEGGGGALIAPPFLEACPNSWKCWIFHSSWNLEISFFSKFFWLKLEYTWNFIFTIGILVSWKMNSLKIPQELLV
jgi:hypothetical protein